MMNQNNNKQNSYNEEDLIIMLLTISIVAKRWADKIADAHITIED